MFALIERVGLFIRFLMGPIFQFTKLSAVRVLPTHMAYVRLRVHAPCYRVYHKRERVMRWRKVNKWQHASSCQKRRVQIHFTQQKKCPIFFLTLASTTRIPVKTRGTPWAKKKLTSSYKTGPWPEWQDFFLLY